MNAFSWLIGFVKGLTDIWTWLSTPLLPDIDISSPILLLSTTALAIILGVKLVKVFL